MGRSARLRLNPMPPNRVSCELTRAASDVSNSALSSSADASTNRRRNVCRNAWVSAFAFTSADFLSSVHSLSMDLSTPRNPGGRFGWSRGGKYVPPATGRVSGVRNIESGQPVPPPAWLT